MLLEGTWVFKEGVLLSSIIPSCGSTWIFKNVVWCPRTTSEDQENSKHTDGGMILNTGTCKIVCATVERRMATDPEKVQVGFRRKYHYLKEKNQACIICSRKLNRSK